jgi:hypothetical protein
VVISDIIQAARNVVQSPSLQKFHVKLSCIILLRLILHPGCVHLPAIPLLLKPYTLFFMSALLSDRYGSKFNLLTSLLISTSIFHTALYKLRLPRTQDSVSVSAATTADNTLLSIWRNHWAFIFDDGPFSTSNTIAAARLLLTSSLTKMCLSTSIA